MKNIKENFKNYIFLLKSYVKNCKLNFCIVTISCFLDPITVLLDTFLLQLVIDAILTKKEFSHIILIICIFFSIKIIISVLSNFLEIYIGEKKAIEINSKINKELLLKSLKTDTIQFDNPQFYNDYAWAIELYVSQSHRAAQLFWKIFSCTLTLISLVSLLAVVNPFIIIFSFISVIITTMINKYLQKKHYLKRNESNFLYRKQNYINRIFYLKNYLFPLKSNNSKNILMHHFDKNTDDLVGIAKKYRGKIYFFETLNIVNVLLFTCATLLFLNYELVHQVISIGLFTSIFYASNSFRTELSTLFNELPNYTSICLNGGKIRRFFEAKSKIEEKSAEQVLPSNNQVFDIALKNISFSYDGEHEILKDLNLNIKAKSKVAIVGENGVGKTTLVKLLLRLYDVNSGEILINGESIQNYKLDEYRLNIGTAFQENVDFSLSIRENMEFYSKVEDSKISQIFDLVGFNKVINKNNASYDTLVTKEFAGDGIEMSGGEKQILSLARLFTKKFGLVILDEPSASLDPLIEYKLNNIIINEIKDSTVILISHRLSTVKNFDKIIYIENGKVYEEGTHLELMEKKGKYYEMFTKQAEQYID